MPAGEDAYFRLQEKNKKLKLALTQAITEIEEHNSEYQHYTGIPLLNRLREIRDENQDA